MPNSDYLYDSQNYVKNDTKLIEENGKYYVYTVASHSNVPINDRLYEKREFKLQVDSYLFPYNKPVLMYHDSGTDNIGNVVWAKYYDIEDNDEAEQLTGMKLKHPQEQDGFILLKLKVQDAEQQKKINDGLYNTVSIGFFSEYMECSICGERIDSMWDMHEHTPGEKYDGETCYYMPRDIEFVEVSVVNIPADRYAIILNKEYEQANSYVENKTEDLVLTDSINSKIDMISRHKKKNNFDHIDFSGNYNKKTTETQSKDETEDVNYNKDNKVNGGATMEKINWDGLDDTVKAKFVKIDEVEKLKEENKKLKDEIESMKPFVDYVSKLKEDEKNSKVNKIVDLRIALELLDESKKDEYIEKISKWDDERIDETLEDLVALAERTIDEETENKEEKPKENEEASEDNSEETENTEEEKDDEEEKNEDEEKESKENKDKEDKEDVNSKDEDGMKKVPKEDDVEIENEDEEVSKSKVDRLHEILNLD